MNTLRHRNTLRSAARLTLLSLPLLSLSASLLGPPAFADAPAALPAPVAAPLAPLVPGSAAAALDAVAGKPQIVGITTKNGTLFLGRVLSGDHTNYLVQAFHFVGRPRTVSQTYGNGRNRRVVRRQEQTVLPDVLAVQYLLRGAAGSHLNPPEVSAGSGTLAASDVKWLQAISPPTKAARKAAAKRNSSAPALVPSAAAPPTTTPPVASVPPVAASAPASPWAWTMTTLWPTSGVKK